MVSLESRYISSQVKIISGMLFIVFKNKNKRSLQFFKKRRDRLLLFIDYDVTKRNVEHICTATRISFPFSQWRDSWTFNARKDRSLF